MEQHLYTLRRSRRALVLAAAGAVLLALAMQAGPARADAGAPITVARVR